MLHFELFDRTHHNKTPKTGISIPDEINYLRGLYASNIKNIKKYYEEKKISVKNRNILSQILDNFNLMVDSSLEDFVYVNESSIDRLEKTFGLTSTSNKGKVNPPFFYANGGSTVMLSEYNTYGINHIAKEWRSFPCLEVTHHPRNDMRLLLPYDNDDGSNGGIACVKLNMLALAIKYREFVKEQMFNERNGLPMLTKTMFLSRNVIPGIVESDLDHRFLNRIMDEFYGVKETTPGNKHAFMINEPYHKLNKTSSQILKTISEGQFKFDNLMRNIPMLVTQDAGQLLTFIDVPTNNNSNWFYVISRLRFMCFLYDVSPARRMNSDYIESWKLLAKQMERSKSMISGFPVKYESEINGYLEKIKGMTY